METMTLPENKLLETGDFLMKNSGNQQIAIQKESEFLRFKMEQDDPRSGIEIYINSTEVNMLAHYLNKNFDLSLVPSFAAAIEYQNQKEELARLREVQDQLTTRNDELRKALKGARDTLQHLADGEILIDSEIKSAAILATAYIDGDL